MFQSEGPHFFVKLLKLFKNFFREDHHQPLLASLSNTIIHSPGGNPLHATEDVQATFLIRLGEYLNHLRHDQLEIALKLEEKMQNSDDENLNHEWRNKVIDIYRKYNDTFPENFKIKCKLGGAHSPYFGILPGSIFDYTRKFTNFSQMVICGHSENMDSIMFLCGSTS